jgi:hypothetical protein
MAEDTEHTGGDPGEGQQIDLAQVRVEGIMLQVASELMSIGAGQLGLIPQMVNGGDGVQASLAINGADALIEAFVGTLPEGTALPPQVQELRGAVADLKLAFAEAVAQSAGEGAPTGSPAPPTPPPAPPAPERPKIWTPGGDV